jgi:hypothetical protein
LPIAPDGRWTDDPAAADIIADLKKSGISAEAACAARVAYTSSQDKIAQILNRTKGLPKGPCAVFQYYAPDGKPLGHNRLRPVTPRMENRDGQPRPRKYEAPSGAPSKVYIMPGSRT